MTMFTAFDIVVFLIVIIGAIMGALRGFVQVALSLAAWVVGAIALRYYYAPARTIFEGYTQSQSSGALLAVIVVFFVPFIVIRLLAAMIGARVRESIIGPVDRFLGFGFGVVRSVIVCSLLYLLITFGYDTAFGGGAPKPEWLRGSRTEPLLRVTSGALVNYVEQRRGQVSASGAGYDRRARDAIGSLIK